MTDAPGGPDPAFADPRLARLYDAAEGSREDLNAYVAIAEELGARSVLDVGAGTGVLALRLAARGLDVVAVDPAAAMLDVARSKPGAERVRWVVGDAAGLPPLQVDLAVMTGNVAQVFVTDAAWRATLRGVHAALAPGGHLVLETRDPARRAWEEWTPEHRDLFDVDGGEAAQWNEVTEVALPLVTFHATTRLPDGSELHSDSTLRFRTREELDASLAEAGFAVVEVRDAPDRPGREWVYLARRTEGPGMEPGARGEAEHDLELERFWSEARRQARLENVPAYFGPTPLASLVPPAWAFDEDPAEADRLLGLVLDGTASAVTSVRDDLGPDDLPEPGGMSILLDGAGRPRALVVTTSVEVLPLDEVPESHALAEGADSLAAWRAELERRGVRPGTLLVLERLSLLHPSPDSRATLRGMFGR